MGALNAFGFRVLKNLKPDESAVVSSPSFATLLALLHNGASGETLEQVRSVYVNNNILDATDGPKALHNMVCSNNAFSLIQTTRILVAQNLEISESYLDFVNVLGLQLEKVNFKQDAERIRTELNQWMAGHTLSDTSDALKLVEPSSQMILLNAVCFKDFWKFPFTSCESRVFNNMPTPPDAFITTEGFYAVDIIDDFAMVRIPYESFNGSLYVILPQNERETKDLTFEMMSRLLDNVVAVEPKYIKLSLPMFKVDKSFNVARLLQSMGVTSAFDPEKAEFGGLADKMCISDMTQRIAFSINNYAEPAAVGCRVKPNEEWIFDRPFVFVVRDDETDIHLITGVVQNLRLE
ncbi:Serpin B10 [Halotydeus destructor]|nr:Serpin B10 [Halotydeus destructor]